MSAPLPAAGVDFDPARLHEYLDGVLGLAGVPHIERIGGGQSNPTYFVTVGADRLVLRKRPAAALVSSAHDVGREYRILVALSGGPVPVPEPVHYCEDDTVLGTAFYLMRRIDGRLFSDARLPELPPEQRRAVYGAQARAMAALHSVDWVGAGLADLARPGNFLERQVERWTAAFGDEREDDVTEVHDWLVERLPPVGRLCLVHGDFKLNNLLYGDGGTGVVAVLDWELATIGDPMFDLGHNWAATWATTPDEYGGLYGTDLAGAALPSADEFFAAYYEASGCSERVEPFHQVLGLLRYAGIFLGIGQRAVAGVASAANAADKGLLASIFLDRALGLVRG